MQRQAFAQQSSASPASEAPDPVDSDFRDAALRLGKALPQPRQLVVEGAGP